MSPPSTDTPRRMLRESIIAATLFTVVLTVYVLTLAPGVLMNDSGEFQTQVATLGNTHPTGYPVYLLLSKPVTWLPWHDVAWRVNLSSAIAAALTVTALYLLGRTLTGRRWLSLTAAIALAASPTFWSQAIIAEVYAHAAAITVAVLFSLAEWQRTNQKRWLFVAAFCGGVSLGVHLTVALMAPAAVVFVACHRENRWPNIGVSAAGALTGCVATLIAFVVVDGNRPPSDYFNAVIEPSRSAWGLQPDELDSLPERMKFSVTAVQYRENLHQPTAAGLQRQLASYCQNLPRELSLLWLIAAAAGAYRLVRVNWQFALLLGLALTTHLLYVIHHDMGDIHVGYIPTYVLLTAFALSAMGAASRSAEPNNSTPPRWQTAIEFGVSLMLLASTLVPLVADEHFMSSGRPRFWVPPGEPPFEVDYSPKLNQQLSACVSELDDHAIVFTEWGLLYPFYYVAHVQQQRTGLTFVQTYPAINQTQLAESAVQFISEQIVTRPVYVSEPLPEVADVYTFESCRPGGLLLFRLHRRQDASGLDESANN